MILWAVGLLPEIAQVEETDLAERQARPVCKSGTWAALLAPQRKVGTAQRKARLRIQRLATVETAYVLDCSPENVAVAKSRLHSSALDRDRPVLNGSCPLSSGCA